jgi:curved DNA-binding protein CbpA
LTCFEGDCCVRVRLAPTRLTASTARRAAPTRLPYTQIRRAYRNLITKEHPDKGGDAEKFGAIQRAYDVLSSEPKRKQYDATGRADRTADEELMESFGGGACFPRDCVLALHARARDATYARRVTQETPAHARSSQASSATSCAWRRRSGTT